MSVTIKQLSEKCGLSISTVSKALNNYSDVNEDTKKRVLDTARESGYFPNALARALKTNRTFNLGVLFVDEFGSGLTHAFFASVLDSFKRSAESKGYDITFINHNIGQTNMTYLEHCRYRNVDGVCLACIDFDSPEVIQLMDSGFPAVTIDHVFNNRTCVMSDNVTGISDLVRYVVGQGHRRIAYVHGKASSVTENRLFGFHRAMAEFGLSVEPGHLAETDYQDPTLCYQAVKQLLSGPNRPSCIFMPDDFAAIGGMDAIRDAGLSIPGDLSVVGYDGYRLLQMLHPRLTTLRQNTQKIGETAALALIDCIDDPYTAWGQTILIPGDLLPGETVGPWNA